MPIELSTPTPRNGAQTRKRVLEVAEGLFAELGYEKTTLRAIASKVGIKQPSLYKHFATKQELYGAVLQSAFEPLTSYLQAFGETGEDSVLSQFLAAPMFELLAEHPAAARLVYRELLQGSEMHPFMDEWLRTSFTLAREALRKRGFTDEQIPHVVVSFHAVVMHFFAFGPDVARYLELPFEPKRAARKQAELLKELSQVVEEVRARREKP